MSTTGPITRATRPVTTASDAGVAAAPERLVGVFFAAAFLGCGLGGGSHEVLSSGHEAASASAPETISLISWVISD